MKKKKDKYPVPNHVARAEGSLLKRAGEAFGLVCFAAEEMSAVQAELGELTRECQAQIDSYTTQKEQLTRFSEVNAEFIGKLATVCEK
jgi:hypothetical protein